jgi:hypothetical protein
MTSSRSIRLCFAAGICAFAWIIRVNAADVPPAGPPPEAVQACSGKSSGDACEVSFGPRSESGTCTVLDGVMACHPRRPPHHAPPPEAIEACAGESEGAACAVTLGGNTLDGTCLTGPGGSGVACRPSRVPPPDP